MDENKTHVNKRARSAVRRYLATYFGERDLEGVLSMLSSHATGFGSGEQEVFLTPGQVPRGFEEDIRNMLGPIHYDILTEVSEERFHWAIVVLSDRASSWIVPMT